MRASAADLKFLQQSRRGSFRNFKSKSGTRIINLLVPLCFRSSCQRVPQCITNFGSGALVRPWINRFSTASPAAIGTGSEVVIYIGDNDAEPYRVLSWRDDLD